jgi:hypothetical protein
MEERPMAGPGMKPYVKLASTLVLIGGGIFSLERYGLSELEGPQHAFHLDGTILSILVIAPFALIAAGAVVFAWGKMRRL